MTTPLVPNINDFWSHFKDIEKLADSASGDMKVLLSLFSNLRKVYENFAAALRILGENFHKEISRHFNSEEKNFAYYHYLGNYILKVSEINVEFGKKIEKDVFAPYYDFSLTIDGSNHEALNKIYRTLLSIESSKTQQKKNQDNFYRNSRTAEKTQEAFVKLVDENKGEELLMKAQDKMIKTKMEAEEAGQLYRQQIATTNQWWKKLYSEYRNVFKVYDQNEDNKAEYNKGAVIKLVRHLEGFYSKDGEPFENFEARFQELDEKSASRPDTFKLVTSGKLDEILTAQPGEEYVSYETKRKNDEANIAKSLEEEEYSLIAGSADEATLQFIQEYARTFQPKGLLSLNSTVASTDQNESIVSDEISSPGMKSPSGAGTEDNHKKMLSLVTTMPNRKFLVDNLVKQREPMKDTYEVRLSFKLYNRLQELLVKVLKEIVRENDYETLVQMLPLLTKYYTIKDGQPFYLYQYFRTMTLWEDSALWASIMKTLHDKKAYEESQRQKKYQEIEKTYAQPQLMNKIWSFGKQFAAALDLGKKGGLTESEIYTSVLQELSYYLSRLTKNILIASEIQMRLSFDVGIDKEEIAEFVMTQKRQIDDLVREKIKNYPLSKNKKAMVKWGKFFPLYLSLEFLEPKDLLKILALNSSMKNNFKRKVYRTIFYQYGEQLTFPKRFIIWKNILGVRDMKLNYKDLLEEYLQMSPEDKSMRSVEDVIQIDVLRSFNKHPTCDHKILQELLKSYAAYDKKISYCQGMNYIMGFLYINTQDPETSFKIFVTVMDRFMKGTFDEDFKELKLHFFKFNRLLELYAPDLAEHFRNEKIEPSFFIPSWFITVFANSFQYSTKSQLLEKIWDLFVLDGMKVVFKTALLILMEYKKDLLDMKFDGILHFLSDLGKEELFTNVSYWKVVNGEVPVEEASREYNFVKNFGDLMKNVHVTKQLLRTFEGDFEVMETRIGRLLNLNKKK